MQRNGFTIPQGFPSKGRFDHFGQRPSDTAGNIVGAGIRVEDALAYLARLPEEEGNQKRKIRTHNRHRCDGASCRRASAARPRRANYKFYFVCRFPVTDVFKTVYAAAQIAGKEVGAQIIWVAPASQTVEDQVNMLTQTIASKPDGIALMLSETEPFDEVCRAAIAKGIPTSLSIPAIPVRRLRRFRSSRMSARISTGLESLMASRSSSSIRETEARRFLQLSAWTLCT